MHRGGHPGTLGSHVGDHDPDGEWLHFGDAVALADAFACADAFSCADAVALTCARTFPDAVTFSPSDAIAFVRPVRRADGR
jgi:hypothetical protein